MDSDFTVSRQNDGYIVISERGMNIYDFKPRDSGDALRWIEQLSRKTWVTARILGEVARLYANGVGVKYRP